MDEQYLKHLKEENVELSKKINHLLKYRPDRKISSERCLKAVIDQTNNDGDAQDRTIEKINLELYRQLILLEKIMPPKDDYVR